MMKKGDVVVVANDDDDEGQTNASQNHVTATLCIEDFFSGLTIYSSTPHIKVEVA
jgi:hypothetical protein